MIATVKALFDGTWITGRADRQGAAAEPAAGANSRVLPNCITDAMKMTWGEELDRRNNWALPEAGDGPVPAKTDLFRQELWRIDRPGLKTDRSVKS